MRRTPGKGPRRDAAAYRVYASVSQIEGGGPSTGAAAPETGRERRKMLVQQSGEAKRASGAKTGYKRLDTLQHCGDHADGLHDRLLYLLLHPAFEIDNIVGDLLYR